MGATHVAFASTRVMATCAVVGQGVGVAAAYAIQHGLEPAELADNATAVQAIQQRLLRDDGYLIGVRNDDAHDLTRMATATASSAQVGGEAGNVLSGQTRAVHGEAGAPIRRSNPGTHRWMSDPACALPAWLELQWEIPIALGSIQLVFDTGMHRPLTLSHSDGYLQRMQWGQPQEETVRDYCVEVKQGGVWKRVTDVRGNYQRRRVHALSDCAGVDALRITITGTNGINHARICEVRAYAPDSQVWCSDQP